MLHQMRVFPGHPATFFVLSRAPRRLRALIPSDQ
jgi:hypothetical protein